MTQDFNPADFVGHLANVLKVEVKGQRIRVGLSLPLNRDLMIQLMEHEGAQVFAGFGFMQPQLPLLVPDPLPTMASDKTHLVSSSGDAILPHKFREGFQDAKVCMFCHMAEGHEIHEIPADAGLQKVDRDAEPKRSRRSRDNGAAPDGAKLAEMTAWGNTPHAFEARTEDNRCAKCGLDADQDLRGEPLHVSEAAAGLIEDARKTPATEDEARDQADAEARLANQSKG